MAHQVATAWVGPHRLDDRLDVRGFKPWVIKAVDQCTSFPPGAVRLGEKPQCKVLSRGVGGARPQLGPVAVYKAKEVGEFVLRQPEAFLAACLKHKQLIDHDIVLTSSGIGTIGRAAMYRNSSPRAGAQTATVDNHVSIIRLRGDRLVPEYVCAFLNSKFGKAWSEWGTTGSTRLLELSTSKISRFLVPTPEIPLQRHIASKVEIVERCHSEIAELDSRCKSLLDNDLEATGDLEVLEQAQNGFSVGKPEFRSHLLPAGGFSVMLDPALVRHRLDAAGYHPTLLSIRAAVGRSGSVLQALHTVASLASPHRRLLSRREVRTFVSVLHLNEHGYIDEEAGIAHDPSSNGVSCEKGDVLVSCINPAANRIGVFDADSQPAACSVEFVILKTDKLSPHYVAYALRSAIVRHQLVHLGRGTSSSRRRVDESELMECLIPVVDSADEIGELVNRRQRLARAAARLMKEATSDIESILEGSTEVSAVSREDLGLLNLDDTASLRGKRP